MKSSTKRITLFDYGAGNLHSLAKALAVPDSDLQVEVRIEPDPLKALETDMFILPGVGAFGPAAERLAPAKPAIRDALLGGLPALGICLGMQLLFDSSEEGEGSGLGVIPGSVRQIDSPRIPHIGWNRVEPTKQWSNGRGRVLQPPAMAYFANSYVCSPFDTTVISATTTHDSDTFASMVSVARTIGVQFHPEKSSAPGVDFIRRIILEALQ